MSAIIVSAFPGCGKSQCVKDHPELRIKDSDSSNFSWIKDENINNTRERNPEFPKNYIEYLKSIKDDYDIIFVSSHKEVREALTNELIPYFLVCPRLECKQEYLKRYKNRGNDESFISLLDNKWEEWINEIIQIYKHKPLYLKENEYINDYLEYFLTEGEKNWNYLKENLKTYKDWSSELEQERGVKIIDDDGARALASEGRLDELITKQEAEKYFVRCTISGLGSSIANAARKRAMQEYMNRK